MARAFLPQGAESEVVVDSDRCAEVQIERKTPVRDPVVTVLLGDDVLESQVAGIEHDTDVIGRAELEVEDVEPHLEHRGIGLRRLPFGDLRLVLSESYADIDAGYEVEILAHGDVVAGHGADYEETQFFKELLIVGSGAAGIFCKGVADGTADRKVVDHEVVELGQDFEVAAGLNGRGGRRDGRLRAGSVPGERSRYKHVTALLGAQCGGHSDQCKTEKQFLHKT